METKTPYYAVIFTSTLTYSDNGYDVMAEQMEQLAKQQTGYLGVESAREEVGISVSYWESLEAIANWKYECGLTLFAQQKGMKIGILGIRVRICLVEREYDFTR